MTVEIQHLLSKVAYDLHLFEKHAVQAPDVNFYVTAWLVALVEQSHLVLDHAHNFVDVATVRMD